MITVRVRSDKDSHFLTAFADRTCRVQWVFSVALWITLVMNQTVIVPAVASAESGSETTPSYIPPYMRTPELPDRRVISPVPTEPVCPPLGGAATALSHGKVIEASPRDDTACYNRGAAYVRLGQYQRAITDYNEAIGINPYEARADTMRAHVSTGNRRD